MKKRVLSSLLALALCLGLTPTLSLPARAVGEESFTYTAPNGVVYRYGGDVLGTGDRVYRTYFLAVGYEGEPTDITIPYGIEGTYINEAGEEVEFSKRVDGIKYGAFEECDSLETVTIQGCPNLDGGFYRCASLRVLDLSECTATRIDRSTFAYECPSLETVILPAGLTYLNGSAFGYCSNLRDVYFLGSDAPSVSLGSTLHSAFNNAAVFHVPADGSGYGWNSKDNYRHAVVRGNEDDVPYGVDFAVRGWAPGSVKGTVLDLGTYWSRDSYNSSAVGEATYTVTNTASDTLTFEVTKGSGNSGKVWCSVPYNTDQYSRLYPGQTIESVPIILSSNALETPGTFEETFILTATGIYTRETHSETITVRYTVKDRKTAFELSETEVDFGDIPVGLSLDEMPTVTVTATNHLSQKGYVHLWNTSKSESNPYYAEFVEGDDKTAISNGESVTFRLQLTSYGLEYYLREGKLDVGVTLRDQPKSSATILGTGDVTLKANPVHSSGLSLSSSTLDLGKTESAYYSANRFLNTSVTLTNTGTQDVVLTPSSLSNFVVAGAFSMTGSCTLKAGESLLVTLAPKEGLKPGTYEETVTIWGGENSVKLRVKFVVGGESVEVTPSSLDFGRQTEGYEQPPAQTITVKNTGAETITLTQPAAVNYEVGRLSRTSLNAGESATFTVRPKVGLKAENGKSKQYEESITIQTSKGQSQTIGVTFTVDPVGSITAEPSSASFGGLLLGYEQPAAQTITIRNPGPSDVTLKQPVLTSSDFTVGRLSATTLKAGQSATFTVQPKAGLKEGTYTSVITVATAGTASVEIPVAFEVYLFDENDKPNGWAQAEVAAAIAANLVPQSQRANYTADITRSEFCALATQLYETVTGQEITGRSTFTDTDDVNVQKMAYVKVVDGRGEGIFDPNSRITRQEAATILSRLANALNHPLPDSATAFSDQAYIQSWAAKAVGQVNAAGIMKGTAPDVFSPGMNYTREQSILTVVRLYRYVTEKS